ncbi:MAG: nucleotidyltransferase family protein [Salinisphaera sp.]|nr:nucleotidyltransferase family protein [Salinisphaera sp.]
MKNATIVLAAGQSMRFGAADKLLQPVAGMPLIAQTLSAIRLATTGPIVLVLGRQPRALLRVLAQHGLLGSRVIICRNPHPDKGMGQSLAVGLRAMPRLASAINIHLADMPGVDQRLLHRINRAMTPLTDVVRAVHNARPGHPVRLRRALLDNARLLGCTGAQSVIKAVPASRCVFIQGPASCVQDIDTRQMRRTLIWRWRTHRIPTHL